MADDNDTEFTAHERVHLAMLVTKIGGAHPGPTSPTTARKQHAQGDLEVVRIGRQIKVRATNRHYASPKGPQSRPDVERILDAATAQRPESPGATFIPN